MIKENGTIVIPIDFSKQSLVGIKNSYNLGRYSNSKLMILHVYNKTGEENIAELEALVKQTAVESGLACEYKLRKGDIFNETDRVATKYKASLIVAGLPPLVKFRSLFGTNSSSKFIKNAPCPVLTTRTTIYESGCKNILMPFDLSAESREKTGTAIQMAKYFGAEIKIVSVFDPNDSNYENKILPYIQQVKRYIKERGVSCSNKTIASKNIAESVVEYGNKNNCDLIIQMNKPDLSIGEMFSGTTSQKIVDISNIPVLSINPMIRESISSGIH